MPQDASRPSANICAFEFARILRCVINIIITIVITIIITIAILLLLFMFYLFQ